MNLWNHRNLWECFGAQRAAVGRWVSEKFSDTETRTLYNARRLWECFGEQREAVV